MGEAFTMGGGHISLHCDDSRPAPCHPLTEMEEEEPHHRSAPAVEMGKNQQQGMCPPPPFAHAEQSGGKGGRSGGKGGSHGDRTWQRKGNAAPKPPQETKDLHEVVPFQQH